ncbi:MAG TPA: class I SAM-dependent methyltransferase [Dehalococcoidia bacterium]|nr:class I SAM-dependent methyltransferase [Dehalococcoidia bacterium]
MDEYLNKNLDMWNDWAPLHAESEFYDVEGFKNGRNTLDSIELEEVGDVTGKSLLHLQCHFGMDTLSWARLGARVTGIDFSDKAIDIACSLSKEMGIKADFICCNIYDLPENLTGTFDIVYTSAGVLGWLPDLKQWAEIIYHYLKPGGFFYILDSHPFSHVFDDSKDVTELNVKHSYFHSPEPTKWEIDGSYAGARTDRQYISYEWTHSMGDIINSLISSGLRIEFLHEFPVLFFKWFPFMKQDEEGWWRLEGNRIPLTFSIKATKP